MGERYEERNGRPRTFPGVRIDSRLERQLERVKVQGYLLDFRSNAEGLTVVRPQEVEGKDLRTLDVFVGGTPDERLSASRYLFSLLLEKLDNLDHGALHPGNVLQVEGSFKFLDPIANAAYLGVLPEESAATYGVWLWTFRMPAGWKVKDWDLICLLRMVVLLAQGPPWDVPRSLPEVVDLCRRWVKELLEDRKEMLPGDVRTAPLGGTLALLEEIAALPPAEVDHLRIIEKLLDEILSPGQQQKKMLPALDERRLVERAAIYRISTEKIVACISSELMRRSCQREIELSNKSENFLRAGIYPGSRRHVKRSACYNAERMFTAYGVSQEEAKRKVESLLEDLDLIDGRLEREAWQKEIKIYLREKCKSRKYTLQQFLEMKSVLMQRDLTERQARLQLRQYLEQEGYSQKGDFPWS